jgi:hypothetical protein
MVDSFIFEKIFYMKKTLIIITAFVFTAAGLVAQNKLPALDKSPMDMSYCPNSYPIQKISDKITDPLTARVVYSRPQKNNRVIFGELVEYGKVWRLGANEATEIEFFQTVRVNDKKIKKGRYTMYCIPYADKWTLIINKETDTWGAFKYDDKKDLVRIDLPVQKQTEILDAFVMAFDKSTTGCNLIMAWDDVKVTMPIVY